MIMIKILIMKMIMIMMMNIFSYTYLFSLFSLSLFSLSTLKLGIYSKIFYISDNNRDTDKKLTVYDPWGQPTTSRISWMT